MRVLGLDMGGRQWTSVRAYRLTYGDWTMALKMHGCGRKTNCELSANRWERQRCMAIPPSWELLARILCGKEHKEASSELASDEEKVD